jgi:hypothetical protein
MHRCPSWVLLRITIQFNSNYTVLNTMNRTPASDFGWMHGAKQNFKKNIISDSLDDC